MEDVDLRKIPEVAYLNTDNAWRYRAIVHYCYRKHEHMQTYVYPEDIFREYVNIPVEIDTKTLSDIAQTTDGNFYRATNNNELKKIYKDIDKLEKTKFNVKHFAKRYEAYQPFALAALLVLLVEILLRITWFRRIP